jgi:hypothetical protein
LLPTSELPPLRILALDGAPVGSPREWTPLWVEALIPAEDWAGAELWRGAEPIALGLRRLGGEVRVVGEWPRSGTGNYELRLRWRSRDYRLTFAVQPEKLSSESYARMLEDLETRLPASIALSLQRLGGLSGLELLSPQESTIAEEVHRLRHAISGGTGRPGLAAILPEIARDPHSILSPQEIWVRRGRARRPHPARLVHALTSAGNLAVDLKPLRVLDTRVEHTTDVYENRLVKAFSNQVYRRLHRVRRLSLPSAVQEEIEHLLLTLQAAQRQAAFLSDVRELDHTPDQVSMVLLKRSAYRAALEGYLEFQRRIAVRLEAAALEAPLQNLPYLYQVWGALTIIDVLLTVGKTLGYRLVRERLIGREGGGAFLRILPDGGPAVILLHPPTGTQVRLIPERSYSAASSSGLRSITYTQRPDIAIEIQDPGESPRVLLFDPKYKLDGEALAEDGSDGKPEKVDIDKMHAYRDAIRDPEGRRVVEHAAIMYPGPTQIFEYGIEALSAYPGTTERGLQQHLTGTLTGALRSA